jgi:hypothetical protein
MNERARRPLSRRARALAIGSVQGSRGDLARCERRHGS